MRGASAAHQLDISLLMPLSRTGSQPSDSRVRIAKTSPSEDITLQNYFIIENDRAVDVVTSTQQLEQRSQYGWRLVLDSSGEDWRTALTKAHAYAREQQKRCHLPTPKSDEEISQILDKVYRIVFGDERWEALGRLYALNPQKAMEIAQETMAKRFGHEQAQAPPAEEHSTATPAASAEGDAARPAAENRSRRGRKNTDA